MVSAYIVKSPKYNQPWIVLTDSTSLNLDNSLEFGLGIREFNYELTLCCTNQDNPHNVSEDFCLISSSLFDLSSPAKYLEVSDVAISNLQNNRTIWSNKQSSGFSSYILKDMFQNSEDGNYGLLYIPMSDHNIIVRTGDEHYVDFNYIRRLSCKHFRKVLVNNTHIPGFICICYRKWSTILNIFKSICETGDPYSLIKANCFDNVLTRARLLTYLQQEGFDITGMDGLILTNNCMVYKLKNSLLSLINLVDYRKSFFDLLPIGSKTDSLIIANEFLEYKGISTLYPILFDILNININWYLTPFGRVSHSLNRDLLSLLGSFISTEVSESKYEMDLLLNKSNIKTIIQNWSKKHSTTHPLETIGTVLAKTKDLSSNSNYYHVRYEYNPPTTIIIPLKKINVKNKQHDLLIPISTLYKRNINYCYSLANLLKNMDSNIDLITNYTTDSSDSLCHICYDTLIITGFSKYKVCTIVEEVAPTLEKYEEYLECFTHFNSERRRSTPTTMICGYINSMVTEFGLILEYNAKLTNIFRLMRSSATKHTLVFHSNLSEVEILFKSLLSINDTIFREGSRNLIFGVYWINNCKQSYDLTTEYFIYWQPIYISKLCSRIGFFPERIIIGKTHLMFYGQGKTDKFQAPLALLNMKTRTNNPIIILHMSPMYNLIKNSLLIEIDLTNDSQIPCEVTPIYESIFQNLNGYEDIYANLVNPNLFEIQTIDMLNATNTCFSDCMMRFHL